MKSLFSLLLILFSFYIHLHALDLLERPTKGYQYETLRFRFVKNLHFKNPFDLETNRVELFIQQPDSSKLVLSFFYDGLNKNNDEQWEARFTPKHVGFHRFSIFIHKQVQTQFELFVDVNKKKKLGGLKISERLGVFEYDSGESFRGIGLNVCWSDNYEYYFRKMRNAGMNVTRIWMCPWHLPFEWQETGLGRYDLETAHRLDTILQLAENYGIYIILCMDYHGIAPKGPGFFKEDRWLVNPYNIINGGPCADKLEFFTNPEAKAYSKKKYKYLISRFGHSQNIAAWELINEADLMAGKAIPINQWHTEMAEYVKSIDAHKHLVSSSSTRRYVEKLVDAFKSSAMDFVMFHEYNSLDIATHLTFLIETGIEYYQKPVVMGEFGVEYRGGERTYKADSQHVGLHNGIWAGWFSETPIIPLSWWWDSYIDLHDLWYEYANLSRFAEKMDFNVKHIAFKTLPTENSKTNIKEQRTCTVRCMYVGNHCALWIKNENYKWSLMSEGVVPEKIETFTQIIPGLASGHYYITWYDPQTGQFFEKASEGVVMEDGMLSLAVPSFSKDLACIIARQS